MITEAKNMGNSTTEATNQNSDELKTADKIEIGKDLSFASKKDKSHIIQFKESLKHYSDNFASAVSLGNDIPIFLDTSVLLRTYSISFKAREKLKEFFEQNHTRIFIPRQVQKEFTKNRESVIEDFFTDATKKLPDNFRSNIINKLQAFLDTNKIILKDYDFVETKLEKIKRDAEKLLQKLEDEIEEVKEANKNIKYTDELLEIFSHFNLLDGLTSDEIKIVKSEFDEFKKSITDTSKIDVEIGKPYRAFPGMGDIKLKPDDPYGDYVIFHEILKFVKQKSTDVAFLTYDITKGDWLDKNKHPHIHYIENVYLNTGKAIFILDAERTFEDLLDISFKSVYGGRKSLDYDDEEFIGTFLFLWSQLEGILRELTYHFGLETKKVTPLLGIIQHLYRLGILEQEFMGEFDELRRLRNEIVHGYYYNLDLSANTKEFILQRMQSLVDKIASLKEYQISQLETSLHPNIAFTQKVP